MSSILYKNGIFNNFFNAFHLTIKEELSIIQNKMEKENPISQEIAQKVIRELNSLFAIEVPFRSLSESEKQLIVLNTLKKLFSALVPGQQMCEIKKFIERMIPVFESCSLENVLSHTDLLPEWIQEIVDSQKLFKKCLNAPSYENGNSKGVLYKIKKDGKTRGYLFGTMHQLISPELKKASKISSCVYQKLCKCAIIGTEIKISSCALGSVEENLINVAKTQGIVNFGIDAEERYELKNEIKSLEKLNKTEQNEEDMKQQLCEIAKAYELGNEERLKTLLVNIDSSSKIKEIEKTRNGLMAQNIHAFLKACESNGKKTILSKCFFAMGIIHLVEDNNVAEILSKRGWELTNFFEKPHL